MSPTTTSTRWCPTTEQLMILEEMYKGGIRTPNASQIQQITTHLSLYGKIEGKNVFYWFQNHKARDRQKLRRKLLNKQQQQQQHQQIIINQHHHLLHHFHGTPHHQSSSSGFNHHFPHYHHLPKFLHHPHPQEGLVVMKEEPNEVMNYKSWVMDNNNIPVDKKVVDVDQMIMMENSSKMMYGHDWMMMMDVGSEATISPSCGSNYNKQPLKTLELFPIKSTAGSNFKDE